MVSAESSHSTTGSSTPSRPDGGYASTIGPNGPFATLAQICPFLASEDRSWRAASPTREHRCGAVLEADPATRQVRHATGSGARSGARADSAAVMRSPVVTAPSEADETSAAYLAMT